MDWVSFDEIKRTVTLQMAIERYAISLRRINATTLRGRCPLPTHRSEKKVRRVSPPPSQREWVEHGHANLNHAQRRAVGSVAMSSTSSPQWNSVPFVMRRSNSKSGFSFRPPGSNRHRETRNSVMVNPFRMARKSGDRFRKILRERERAHRILRSPSR